MLFCTHTQNRTQSGFGQAHKFVTYPHIPYVRESGVPLSPLMSMILNCAVGFTQPTSGTAKIEGFDICRDMDRIYTLMGVCPQV